MRVDLLGSQVPEHHDKSQSREPQPRALHRQLQAASRGNRRFARGRLCIHIYCWITEGACAVALALCVPPAFQAVVDKAAAGSSNSWKSGSSSSSHPSLFEHAAAYPQAHQGIDAIYSRANQRCSAPQPIMMLVVTPSPRFFSRFMVLFAALGYEYLPENMNLLLMKTSSPPYNW